MHRHIVVKFTNYVFLQWFVDFLLNNWIQENEATFEVALLYWRDENMKICLLNFIGYNDVYNYLCFCVICNQYVILSADLFPAIFCLVGFPMAISADLWDPDKGASYNIAIVNKRIERLFEDSQKKKFSICLPSSALFKGDQFIISLTTQFQFE